MAADFTPRQTGEINVGLGCLEAGTCLTLDPIFKSIESLTDSSTGEKSRLFVDYFGPGDTEYKYNQGKIVFNTRDAGTNSLGYWFRPSEVNEEKGQLEVGTYLFTFEKTFAELAIDFFDTEYSNETGVLAINGEAITPNYVAKGPDGNIVRQTFYNVNSIVLALGFDKEKGTGDGVNFRISGTPVADVPEPASILGLLAVAGLGFASRRQQAQPTEG
ncbi:MAG: PEP-CTERM sorting domain-containing protein [Leptolyngbya sp. RL_3_1]|nr:PEP-CTERM sorting domain-containing protein [Leptolyngbya sp. RL_3_1]